LIEFHDARGLSVAAGTSMLCQLSDPVVRVKEGRGNQFQMGRCRITGSETLRRSFLSM
jgi:hypothetical protein